MNQLVRGSHLVQRLLGSGGAAKAVACSWLAYGAGPAAAVQPASWMLRPLSTDTESQGDDESAPKKRRGRPRKTTVEEAQHGAFGEAAAAVPEAAPVAVSEGPTESKAPEAPAVPSAGVSVSSPPPVDRPARSGPRRGRPWSFPQGIATVGAPSRVPEVFHSSTSITDLAPGSKGPVGQYVDVPQNVLPEGNAVFYHDPLLVDERVQQPDYGCKAVSAEFAASGRRVLLHRGATQSLLEAVAQGGVSGAEAAAPGSKTFYVDGWTGAGKSVALYSLAAAARAAGWIVMYVPSASLLVRGGRFYHSDIEDDPMWDTPEAARHIINALVGAHGDALKTLQAPGTGGKTLAEVAAAGLEPTSCARETVEAAIALKDGLLAHDSSDGVRTLVVVDDYNTLYSHTDYHEVR